MRVKQLEDHLEVTFRQSWLNTFLKCPEQARREMLNLTQRKVTDAMAMGSAMHKGIELLLCGEYPRASFEAAMQCFDEYVEGIDGPFEWVQVKSRKTALTYVRSCLVSWATWVHPQVRLGSSPSIEESFNVSLETVNLMSVSSDIMTTAEIRLSGTWDLADATPVVWDWKTANQPWEGWEAKRYYVQPTIYSYAYSETRGSEPPLFRYAVMPKGPSPREPQIIEVERDQRHFDWLRTKLTSIVELYLATDAGRLKWPMIDQGWHCSPKWCAAWADCKGAALGAEPW